MDTFFARQREGGVGLNILILKDKEPYSKGGTEVEIFAAKESIPSG